jgi:aminopeptidase
MPKSFETKLQQYADLIVSVGLNLKAGQRLMILAPIESASLVRLIATAAYRKEARLVDILWSDEQISLIRFQNAPRDSFEEFPAWRTRAIEEHLTNGGALISLHAEDPDLLKDQDTKLVGVAINTSMKHSRPISELITRNASNWNVMSMPIPSWSAKVFPNLPREEQEEKLWEAIFETCRINEEDPLAAWQEHARQLSLRSDWLTRQQFDSLHIQGPGTDLTVGLPPGHIWKGGPLKSLTGISFIPNLPTEEVFTLPHKDRVDGVVTTSKPLSYANNLIENIKLKFEAGKVVEYSADEGQQVLHELLETDEGARRLGEIALVPHSAPTSHLDLMFFNTLFDENAASHLAFGKAYKFTLTGGADMSESELSEAGANHSLTHVDFMIGSADMDVDGLLADGTCLPIMRQGEWVFEV